MPYLLWRSRTPFVKPIPWASPFVRPRLSTSPFVRPRAPFVHPCGEVGARAAVAGRLTRPLDPWDGSAISASGRLPAPTSASARRGRHGGQAQRDEDGAELGGEQVQRAERAIRLADERNAKEVVEERAAEQESAAERHVHGAGVEDHTMAPAGPRRTRDRSPNGRLCALRHGDRGRRDFPILWHGLDGLFDEELRPLLSVDLNLRSGLRFRGRGNLLDRDFGFRERFPRRLPGLLARNPCVGGLGRGRLGRLLPLFPWRLAGGDGDGSRRLAESDLRPRTLDRGSRRIPLRRPGLQLDLRLLVFELFLVEFLGHQVVLREA